MITITFKRETAKVNGESGYLYIVKTTNGHAESIGRGTTPTEALLYALNGLSIFGVELISPKEIILWTTEQEKKNG